jgi:Ser/Thr protein kinase RdoA (MazF antagonist)
MTATAGSPAAPPAAVLAAWGLDAAVVVPLGGGLINQTWLATAAGRRFVLQRVNPIFAPGVNADIAAVTDHLRARGIVAPRLLPATPAALVPGAALPTAAPLWVEHDGTWRLMTWLPGVSLERFAAPPQANAAGQLLGRFHRALADYTAPFPHARPFVHDTPRHLANLRAALAQHREHPDHAAVAALAADILALAADLPDLTALPPRVVHGDPKANNILFEPDGGPALALIDLDTVGRMPLPLELGDAFRSWSNPAGEDAAAAQFAVPVFRGAVRGYARAVRGWITPAEVAGIVAGTLTIYVELAARFCADALNESYFGWDPARFPTRGAHNRVRAASQLAAARSLLAQRAAAEAAVAEAFG